MAAQNEPGLGDLFGNLGRQVTTLVRQEVALAKVEFADATKRIARSAVMLVAGGLIAYAGLLVLLAAAVFGLVAAGLDAWLAAGIVGAVVLAVGVLLVWQGLDRLRSTDLVPHQTVESMKDNVEWAKEQAK